MGAKSSTLSAGSLPKNKMAVDATAVNALISQAIGPLSTKLQAALASMVPTADPVADAATTAQLEAVQQQCAVNSQAVATLSVGLDTAKAGLQAAIANLGSATEAELAQAKAAVAAAAADATQALGKCLVLVNDLITTNNTITDNLVSSNTKVSEVRIGLQNLGLKHDDLAAWVTNVDAVANAAAPQTALNTLASTVAANKTAADTAVATVKATADAAAKQTDLAALAQRMVTAENIIGKRIAVRVNRLPTNQDVYEVGTVWEAINFGADTPLRLVTIAQGVWIFQSQISLIKVRFFVSGRYNTYRSTLGNIRFFRPDGTQIPNSWFVCGAASGVGFANAGTAYNGQSIGAGYNASGWADIEVSSAFDPSVTIGKILGNFHPDGDFTSCSGIECWYSNGSRLTFTGPSWRQGADVPMLTVDPPIVCKYGDAVEAAQGPMLTGAQLSNPNDVTYGRVSGQALNSALQALISPTAKTPSQADFDALTARLAALESRVP